MMVISGTLGIVPSVPASFSLRARNEIGRFDIVSAAASQPVPEDERFAFIFRVETADETRYFLQVHSVSYIRVRELLAIITSSVCSQV